MSTRLLPREVYLSILSEKGGVCKLKNPWGKSDNILLIRNGKPSETLKGETLSFKTSVNEKIVISRN